MTATRRSSSARCARPSRPTPVRRASARAGPCSPPTRAALPAAHRRAVPLVWRRAGGGARGARLHAARQRSARRRSSGSCATSCASRGHARAADDGRAARRRAAARQRRERPLRRQPQRQGRRSATTTDATWSPRGLFVGRDRRPLARRRSTPPRRRALAAASPAARSAVPRWAPDGPAHRLPRRPHAADRLRQRRARRRSPGATWPPSPPRGGRAHPRTVAWAAARRHGHRRGRRHRQGAADLPQRRRPPPRLVRRRPQAADRGPPPRHVHDSRPARRPACGSTATCSRPPPPAAGLALAVRRGARTEIRLRGTVLFSAAGRLDDLAFSPDGRWLLAGDADRAVAARPGSGPGVRVLAERRSAVSAPGARTRGWCC